MRDDKVTDGPSSDAWRQPSAESEAWLRQREEHYAQRAAMIDAAFASSGPQLTAEEGARVQERLRRVQALVDGGTDAA